MIARRRSTLSRSSFRHSRTELLGGTMIVEVGAMDRASPYSSGFHRALLLNFIVTARIIRISMFSYRCFETRSFYFCEGNEDCFEGRRRGYIIGFDFGWFSALVDFFFFYDLEFDSVKWIKYNEATSFLLQITNIIFHTRFIFKQIQ